MLTINNPVNNYIYNRRAILFDLISDEEGDISYMDKNDDRGIWKRICQDCLRYNNSRSFQEGWNNITIKARDVVGNTAYFDVFFFVDSKEPIIKKTSPKKNSYTDGTFFVQYYEENPKDIWLRYGNYISGFRNAKLNGCVGGKKANCSIDVNLDDYDGEEIEYSFNITDIAGNFDDSRIVKVKVDLTSPIINYFNYNINGRYVTFNMSITEQNFDSVEYIDNSASRPRWATLCSRLKNNLCIVRKTFAYGSHNIDIQVTDKAGNAVAFPVSFVI